MRSVFKRVFFSFNISCLCGLLVNLFIDLVVNALTISPFVSISPAFVNAFPTAVTAAYVNVLLYGLIGAAFGGLTFIYDCDRIGFVVQNIIYFLGTSVVWVFVSIVLWQLYKYPSALISTVSGYAVTYIIVTIIVYKNMRKSVQQVNTLLNNSEK